MAKHNRFVVVALVLCALGVVTLHGDTRAQSASPAAVIEGSIVDAVGAVIPGATITLEQPPKVLATTISNVSGQFRFEKVGLGTYTLRVALPGFKTAMRNVTIARRDERVSVGSIVLEVGGLTETVTVEGLSMVQTSSGERAMAVRQHGRTPVKFNTESYAHIVSNPFKLTTAEPLSTFAADVDTASYSNVRRFLRDGELPPPDSVRIEELINYFRFSYAEPGGQDPVSITGEVGDCPWAPTHKLALIGVRARPIDDRAPKRRSIVLLIDVSGSMTDANKLPMLKTALRMFVDTLRDDDRLAMVVYAGASGLALPTTAGSERARIHAALDQLEAGGSTNGSDGIRLAYATAREQFIEGGVNRVILATDGDFNVGVTSEGDLVRLIEQEREHGVFLSVLGVGTGNVKDSTMEKLADKGNGNYAYLDSLFEAQRVLVKQGGATLETVAKDVKFQVEFNPAEVSAWKLIGYENRLLADEDFNDDRTDGGELGAGHTVTALYEIVPRGVALPSELTPAGARSVDALRYQSARAATPAASNAEWLTVKIRYKQPDGKKSQLLSRPVRSTAAGTHVPFAAAVAEFGLLLRDREAPAERWRDLVTRIRTLDTRGVVADREDLADLVELASRIK